MYFDMMNWEAVFLLAALWVSFKAGQWHERDKPR